jgi:hypothetical protein
MLFCSQWFHCCSCPLFSSVFVEVSGSNLAQNIGVILRNDFHGFSMPLQVNTGICHYRLLPQPLHFIINEDAIIQRRTA